jgi:hypothetical protein
MLLVILSHAFSAASTLYPYKCMTIYIYQYLGESKHLEYGARTYTQKIYGR